MPESKTQTESKSGLTVFRPDDSFRFDCRHGLDCFTRCCRDITIFLTPYDIIRMKNALNMSSEDFLEAYTVYLVSETSGLPVVTLKLNEDEEKSCPFVTPDGCTIYQDRPWSCRMYPLQPESTKITESKGREYYSVMDVPFCQGFVEKRVSSVRDWLEKQGVPVYKEMELAFKKITMNQALTSQKITNPRLQEMFYMACYDVDRFRRFVFESKFLQTFDIDQETLEKIRSDDVELFQFAMRWLEYGLIGQHVLKVKPEVIKAKKEEFEIT